MALSKREIERIFSINSSDEIKSSLTANKFPFHPAAAAIAITTIVPVDVIVCRLQGEREVLLANDKNVYMYT